VSVEDPSGLLWPLSADEVGGGGGDNQANGVGKQVSLSFARPFHANFKVV